MAQPLMARTLSLAVADRLRQDILDGVHGPGAQLRQDALAAAYGVSRIPVREALFQLEAEGLVMLAPHRGAVVSALRAEEIRDVFELRALLEPRLLAASIPLLDEADLAALDRIEAAFASAIERRDSGAWGRLNGELHLAMYARAPLPRTLAIVAGLLQTSERYTRLQLATPEAWRRAEREHADLVKLCKARHAAAAVSLLGAHIAQVHADLEALATP